MSLVQKISDLATAVGAEVKSRITAYHPGVAKAWVCFGYVGDQMVTWAAYNVQSVTRLAAGKYRVTFTRAMPDANYCWLAFALSASDQPEFNVAVAGNAAGKTPDHVEVICATQAGTLSDTSELNLMVLR